MSQAHVRQAKAWESPGFTLMELIIASLLSAMAMAVIAASLSFCLRLWERKSGAGLGEDPGLAVDVLGDQLGEVFMAWMPEYFGEIGAESYLVGNSQAVSFLTGHPVRAMHLGGPVISRFVLREDTGHLYYAEKAIMPGMDPKAVAEFLLAMPRLEDDPVFVDVGRAKGFKLSYLGRMSDKTPPDPQPAWDPKNGLPTAVLVEVDSVAGGGREQRLFNLGRLNFGTQVKGWRQQVVEQ